MAVGHQLPALPVDITHGGAESQDHQVGLPQEIMGLPPPLLHLHQECCPGGCGKAGVQVIGVPAAIPFYQFAAEFLIRIQRRPDQLKQGQGVIDGAKRIDQRGNFILLHFLADHLGETGAQGNHPGPQAERMGMRWKVKLRSERDGHGFYGVSGIRYQDRKIMNF